MGIPIPTADLVLAMALCTSACLSVSVCLSVTSRSSIENGRTNRAGFRHGSFLPPVLHCVKRKSGNSKIRILGVQQWIADVVAPPSVAVWLT